MPQPMFSSEFPRLWRVRVAPGRGFVAMVMMVVIVPVHMIMRVTVTMMAMIVRVFVHIVSARFCAQQF